jgi:hypothetical protein
MADARMDSPPTPPLASMQRLMGAVERRTTAKRADDHGLKLEG